MNAENWLIILVAGFGEDINVKAINKLHARAMGIDNVNSVARINLHGTINNSCSPMGIGAKKAVLKRLNPLIKYTITTNVINIRKVVNPPPRS